MQKSIIYFLLILPFVFCTFKYDNKQEWAIIVAGSSGYSNYRHQADACHAYHVLRNHGVPAENIILMMYDDIANSPMNPYKGKLFNQPNGTDVYGGCEKDYTGKDVTPQNFLKILQGKDMSGVGTGRVINSGPKDHVFVYFTDHGATGLIAFPSQVLHADDLNKALKAMNKKQQFARLVFYLEACESGSMFENLLPDDINVYAMTAANSHESSWGCYCDNTMHLPCLGDLFSVVWMQDSDKEDLTTETLAKQFKIVKTGTNKSHVMEYGDLSWANEPVGDYQGDSPSSHQVFRETPITGLVDAREIPIYQLEKAIREATGHAERRELRHQLHHLREGREYIDVLVSQLFDDLVINHPHHRRYIDSHRPSHLVDPHCHKILVEVFHQHCMSVTEHTYALRHMYKLSNMCEVMADMREYDLATAVRGMIDSCKEFRATGLRFPKYPVQ